MGQEIERYSAFFEALEAVDLTEEIIVRELRKMAEAEDVEYYTCAILPAALKNILYAAADIIEGLDQS